MLIISNNLYSQTSPKRFVIGNITIKKGTVVIGGFPEVVTVTNTTTDIDNLAQEYKNIKKNL